MARTKPIPESPTPAPSEKDATTATTAPPPLGKPSTLAEMDEAYALLREAVAAYPKKLRGELVDALSAGMLKSGKEIALVASLMEVLSGFERRNG